MARSLFTKRLLAQSDSVKTTTYAPALYFSFTARSSERVRTPKKKKPAYRDGDIIPLTEDLCIYLRKQGTGRYYYARFTVPKPLRQLAQGRRIMVWSLKTADKAKAGYSAIELRLKTLTLLEAGHSVGTISLQDAVDAYLKHFEENAKLGKGGYSIRIFELIKPTLRRLIKFMPTRAALLDLTTESLDRYELARRNPKPFGPELAAAIESARANLRQRNHRFVHRDDENSKRDYLLPSQQGYKLLLERFGEDKITSPLLQSAVQFNRKPAFKTLYLEFYCIKKFLIWCAQKSWYTGTALAHELKKNPEDRLKRERRSEFKSSDYWKLLGYMARKEFRNPSSKNSATEYGNRLLACLTLFLSNTGCRPGEVRHLKWSDIKEGRTADEQLVAEFTIKATNSKVRQHREVVGRASALNAVKKWRQYRESIDRFAKADDYVFANYYTGKPLQGAHEQFARLLKSAGVQKDEYGNPYTLYSLRHFYISWRLREGVSIALVANNAGTSPTMIYKHYSHVRSSEVKAELVRTKARRQVE